MTRELDFHSPRPEGPSGSQAMLRRLGSGAWLLFVWLAVRGSFTAASMIGGLLVVGSIMLLFGGRTDISTARHRVRPVWVAKYLGHFGLELLKANVEVAVAVIAPSRIADSRAIIEVPLPHSSRLVAAILANAVSLTPGTSIIEVAQEPPAFHVHVLDMESADETRSSIAELHWRLVRAVGPADAVEGVEQSAAELRRRVRMERSQRGPVDTEAAMDKWQGGRQE